jgi:iron complex outermembrane receptor protein
MGDARSIRALCLALLLLTATSLFAANGTISGRITRTNGTGIGGVIVQVIELSKVDLTDADGNFSISVPPGTYSVSFVAGDQSATEENVNVTSGTGTRLDKQVDWNLSVAETITVYSASRRTERVVDAPAAVTVAAPEDIQAAAPTGQAPKIIENAPGVDYTQSGLYDLNFNARGFNSSLNRRILTLIDGRDPSVPFLGSQEWAALSYPIDEFASVELVRGPGSALYGPNAFSGVLNMTTKSPKLSPGGRAMLTLGELNTKRLDVRHAGALSGDWYYRVIGGYQNSSDFTRSRNVAPDYTVFCTTTGQTNCLRREPAPLALTEDTIKFGGARLDRNFADTSALTLEAGYATLEGPTFQTGIGRVQVTDVAHPWGRVNYNMTHWNFGVYYDARIAERQVALASGSGVLPGTSGLWEDSNNFNAEAQTNWGFMQDRTLLSLGAAYNRQKVDTADDSGFQTLMSEKRSEHQQSIFGQLEQDFGKKVKLVLASRYDDSTLHDAQFSPKAAVVFSLAPNHTLRVGYNEAFQRPNYSELFLRVVAGAPVPLAAAAAANPASAPLAPVLTQLGFGSLPILARGNSDLEVEKIRSYEAGYAGIFGGKAYVTFDAYSSILTNFVTDLLPGANPAFAPYQVPGTVPAQVAAGVNAFLAAALGANRAGLTTVNGAPAIVVSYANAGRVETQGAELGINYYLGTSWVIDANYSYFDFDVKESRAGDQLLPNAPKKKYNLGLAYRTQRFDAKIAYRHTAAFPWAAGVFVGFVPEYEVVNLSGSYRINDMLAVGADISNAANNEHFEAFGGDLLRRRAVAYLTFNW